MIPIIEVNQLSKKYQIGARQPYLTLRDSLSSLVKTPLGILHRNAIRKVGLNKNDFWALKDINFQVMPGEVVGVIGRNGAGKSTLLKIISRITYPTKGEIRLRGSVASLLEVGTGFSPELTGRENIYLNGAILGMSRKDVKRRFDEIVTFAETERFLDTPVKYYSSGMYTRLAFSVAAHLEPDILLVDEVLAVGDAEFQNKCLGKMEEVTKKEGRTIMFVSHNMGAIQQLCQSVILLNTGIIEKAGKTDEVVSYYLHKQNKKLSISFTKNNRKDGQITKITIMDSNRKPNAHPPVDKDFHIKVDYFIKKRLNKVTFCLEFFYMGELVLLSSESDKDGQLKNLMPGSYSSIVKIPSYLLNAGDYYLDASIQRPGIEFIDRVRNIPFEISVTNNPRYSVFGGRVLGYSAALLDYKTTCIK